MYRAVVLNMGYVESAYVSRIIFLYTKDEKGFATDKEAIQDLAHTLLNCWLEEYNGYQMYYELRKECCKTEFRKAELDGTLREHKFCSKCGNRIYKAPTMSEFQEALYRMPRMVADGFMFDEPNFWTVWCSWKELMSLPKKAFVEITEHAEHDLIAALDIDKVSEEIKQELKFWKEEQSWRYLVED